VRRFDLPSDPIATLTRRRAPRLTERLVAGLGSSSGPIHFVRGIVLADAPPGALGALPAVAGAMLPAEPLVAARIDIEDWVRFGRPEFERIERGRDFYVGDESGRALVRLGADGRLHPEVELHLDAPFRVLAEAADEGSMRTCYLRALTVGDTVAVLGHTELRLDAAATGGYREPPLVAAFSPELGPLHVYDEPAFRQLAAWHAMPWYRRLSVLVRNR
jgi:hypothetical protein